MEEYATMNAKAQRAWDGVPSGALKQATANIQLSEIERLNKCIDEMMIRAEALGGVLANIADRMFGTRPEADCIGGPDICGGRIGDCFNSIGTLGIRLDFAAQQADRLTAL